MAERNFKDNFFSGIALGLLSVALNYILILNLSKVLSGIESIREIMIPPKLQLVVLAINIILFRFIMVKWDKTKTGSGFLLSVFAISVCYIYKNKTLIFR